MLFAAGGSSNVFSFLKPKQSSKHPLSDLQTISRWLQDLPTGDPCPAQQRVVHALVQFNHARLPMSKESLQVLMHLDEQSRDIQYALCIQYMHNPRMSKEIESSLWHTIHDFYWETASGYLAFLMEFVKNPGSSEIQSSIPILSARAIRGFADIFKWHYFRGQCVEGNLWRLLHNLYRITELHHFQNKRFKLYPTEAKASSCMEEYVQALLLGPLGEGNLNQKKIEMVDRWLDNWSELTRLEHTYDPARHFFGVDIALGQGLRRIRPHSDTKSSYRFISTANLLSHLNKCESVLRTGALPAFLGLGETFHLPDGYDLISHAVGVWAPNSVQERRANPREPRAGNCEVVRDLHNICKRIRVERDPVSGMVQRHGLSRGEVLDQEPNGMGTASTNTGVQTHAPATTDEQLSESWMFRDNNEAGVGLKVRKEEGASIKVGKLLALRAGVGVGWQIGVVRRIERPDGAWCIVGVEKLANKIEPVYLERGETKGGTITHFGSHLSEHNRAMPALHFSERSKNFLIKESVGLANGKMCKLLARNTVRRIYLDGVRDKGEGWVMVSYS
jgi:hypothetical protein